ncbi:MAG: hypothetical protein NT013_30040 [Planctomycetia bacterium]|nr:hypothetical protein [Planctomycetia bacterium]
MIRISAWFGLVMALLINTNLFAGGAPENTAVVVNGDSWASRAVANEYLRLRGIPDITVVRLEGLPSFEQLSVEEFRERVLLPVLKTLDERGLSPQIDQVLYSADIPTAIHVGGDIGSQKLPQIFTPVASVNGLTFLYQSVLAKDVRYLDLNSNFYARRVMMNSSDTPWSPDEQRKYAEALKRLEDHSRKERERKPDQSLTDEERAAKETLFKEVLAAFDDLKGAHPKSSELLYNVACAAANCGRPDEAIAALQEAVQADFKSLRERADFKALLDEMKSVVFEMQPTLGFRSSVGWQQNGAPAPVDRGARYLLSTVLAVTSGRGISVTEAIEQLRRSAAADGTRPDGTIYFERNNDVRSTTREWAFKTAANKLERLGVRAVIDEGVLPQKKPDVAGAVIGIADFQWLASGSTIRPGAIVEHLTSFGGIMTAGAGQTPLSEFLRHGAAGSSGTVTEPFAIQAKFPSPFIHVHYASGCSLAESFYQSVTGPYQLLIVGDALCQPWRKKLDVIIEDFDSNASLKDTVSFTPQHRTDGELGVAVFEMYVDGRFIATSPPNRPLMWNTREHGDGAHDLVVLARGNDSVLTTGRWQRSVVVGNSQRTLKVSPTDLPAEHSWSEPLAFNASSPGAKSVVFQHQGATVAQIVGEEGAVSIDPRTLGPGPVSLTPIARFENDVIVRGPAIRINVVPPPLLPALTLPTGKTLADGWHLRVGDGSPVVIQKADGNWLGFAGVAKETRTALDAWFEATDNGVCQFQIHGNVEMTSLKIDDQPQAWPKKSPWWFVPVPLAKGWHRVTLEFTGSESPTLDVRFGNRGTQPLDGTRFRHIAE